MANPPHISEIDFADGLGIRPATISKMTDMLRDIAEVSRAMTEAPTLATADPRFWVVQQKVWHAVPEGYDGTPFIWDPSGVALFDLEDFAKAWVEDYLDQEDIAEGVTEILLGKSVIATLPEGGDPDNAYDWETRILSETKLIDDVEEGVAGDRYCVVWQDWEWKTVDNTLFLTLEACKEHIKANSHHYHQPRSFCMLAWRSPDVARLWKALKSIDWDKVIKLVGAQEPDSLEEGTDG